MQIQQEILSILLDTLSEKELISKYIYDRAKNIVHSKTDFPPFFRYAVRREKEK